MTVAEQLKQQAQQRAAMRLEAYRGIASYIMNVILPDYGVDLSLTDKHDAIREIEEHLALKLQPYADMRNLSMKKMLLEGECLNVRDEGTEVPSTDGRMFKLSRFVEDVDYCDAERETWIVSIGRDRKSGTIIAATMASLYQNPDYECLFLR